MTDNELLSIVTAMLFKEKGILRVEMDNLEEHSIRVKGTGNTWHIVKIESVKKVRK